MFGPMKGFKFKASWILRIADLFGEFREYGWRFGTALDNQPPHLQSENLTSQS